MGTIEKIRNLRSQGRTDEEIEETLEAQGIPKNEIDYSFSQSEIKDAVSGTENQILEEEQTIPDSPNSPQQSYQTGSNQGYSQSYSEQDASQMTPSILSQPPTQESGTPQQDLSSGFESIGSDPYSSQQYQDYSYQSYSPSVSAETMTDIAESVVAEKLSKTTNKLEKVLDMKTNFETRIDTLSDRLQRIEKIIDKLQLSILEKVGSYVTDVSDLKKELVETQKTFKASTEKHGSKSHQKHKK